MEAESSHFTLVQRNLLASSLLSFVAELAQIIIASAAAIQIMPALLVTSYKTTIKNCAQV
eukprot:scaffold123205_cov60-Cyclotella_meneghiniana.AAC.2